MSKSKASWLKHLDFMIIDVFCLFISYTLVSFIRYGKSLFLANAHYQRMSVVIILVSIITSLIFESYNNVLKRGYYLEFRAVFQHICITATGVVMYIYFIRLQYYSSRGVYVGTFALGGLLIYGVHILWKNIIRKNIFKNPLKECVLVIVSSVNADDFIGGLLSEDYAEYRLIGCVLYNCQDRRAEVQGIPVVCELDEVSNYTKDHVIDAILIQPDQVDEGLKRTLRSLVEMGITVHIELAKTYGEFPDMRAGTFGGYKVVTISVHKVRFRQLFAKRFMDIIGGIIGLVFTGTAFVILAPIIKIQSPGPIFFSQVRVGKNGRQFNLYKFRSMYVDAEEHKQELMEKNKMQGQMFKMDDDPRITPLGNFIRKYSIDELPQFWNVLKGDMSLVGTRPPTMDEVKRYEIHHRIRLSIKPGITGLWQVSGRNEITNFEEVVKLDEKYIREWNLGLDIKILGWTIVAVFSRKGSA